MAQILRTMPVLPEIPGIAEWLKGQRLEITADQNPTYTGQHFGPDLFPVVSRLDFKYFETPSAFEPFCIKPVSAVNDFGDCEKIGLVQDWCVRLSKTTA